MLKRVATNLISNYALTIVSMVLGFILVPFLIMKLGKEAYGLIVLAESTILIFDIITISIRVALSRHAAFCFAQNKQEDFIDYLSTGRVISYVSAACVVAVALVLSGSFSALFRVPEPYDLATKQLFFMISFAFAVTILNSAYWSVLYAHNRFDLINIATSGGLVVRAACLLGLFSVLPPAYVNLQVYGLVYLAMVVADNAIVFFWHKKIMPGVRLSAKRFRRDKLREILSLSTYSSLGRISSVVNDSTANFMINRMWGPAANAMFSVAQKFPSLMERLFVNAAWSLTPTFTDLVARKDREKFMMLYGTYTKFITTITAPLCLVIVVTAKPLIRFWVGPDFDISGSMLPVLMVPLFMTIPFSVSGCITNAYAKMKLPSQFGFVSALVNVGLIVLLGKFLGMGLMGIAVASTCSMFANAVFIALYACRISSLSFWHYFRTAYLKPMLWSSAIIVGPYLATRVFHYDIVVSPLNTAVIAALILCDYAGAYFAVLNGNERRQIRETAATVFSKLTPAAAN